MENVLCIMLSNVQFDFFFSTENSKNAPLIPLNHKKIADLHLKGRKNFVNSKVCCNFAPR